MKKTIQITTIGIFILISSPVQADLVELDLLALGCPTYHDFDTPQWSYDFDLGVEFSKIQHVYMDWSGEITGGLADHIGNPDPYPAPVMLNAKLGIYPSYRYTDVSGGWATYPESEFFSEISKFNEGTMPLSDLFDGIGLIRIHYSEYIILDGWYVEHGSVSLAKAKLVVEGTIIPEPSIFVLVMLGGLYIKRIKRI